MLSRESWFPKAESLELGYGKRTDHDCGGGRTLTIRRDERGYHAHCFRCNDSGWVPPAPEPLEVRLKRLANLHSAENHVASQLDLPLPAVRVWADWPPASRLWLLKAGLTSCDLPGLGAYYHPPTDRVVLTVLEPSRGIAFWQARAVDGRLPKYLSPSIPKGSVVPQYGASDTVTLTEDILSAYKVGKVGEGWAMMGTTLTTGLLVKLLARNCKVNVWLDPDRAGRTAASKVLRTLRAHGIQCRDILSDRDPKLLHLDKIKELIDVTRRNDLTPAQVSGTVRAAGQERTQGCVATTDGRDTG